MVLMNMSKDGSSGRSLTEDDAAHLAEVMRGLASPVRLRILSVLREGPTTVTELSERLDAGQAAVSNHLRLLRHLSLASGERQGRHIFYSLFDEHVADLMDQAVDHVTHLPHRAYGAPADVAVPTEPVDPSH